MNRMFYKGLFVGLILLGLNVSTRLFAEDVSSKSDDACIEAGIYSAHGSVIILKAPILDVRKACVKKIMADLGDNIALFQYKRVGRSSENAVDVLTRDQANVVYVCAQVAVAKGATVELTQTNAKKTLESILASENTSALVDAYFRDAGLEGYDVHSRKPLTAQGSFFLNQEQLSDGRLAAISCVLVYENKIKKAFEF